MVRPDPDALEGGQLELVDEQDTAKVFEVRDVQWIGPTDARVQLAGVAGRKAAEALRGSTVRVRTEWFTAPPWPVCVLIGAQVVKSPDATPIGVVQDILHNGAQHVLSIVDEGTESLVPYVDAFIEGVSRDGDTLVVTIDPIEGLLGS